MLLAVAPPNDGSSGGPGSEAVLGAVALRRLAGHTSTVQPGQLVAGVPLERVCEMKRLFVLAEHHGLGAGAALVRWTLGRSAGFVQRRGLGGCAGRSDAKHFQSGVQGSCLRP